MSQETDEKIAFLVQSGKSDFFSALIERYEEKMRRYARKFLSNEDEIKDAVQNVFVKTYVNIHSFDVKRKFSSWLYRIAHNELVNALRKKDKKVLPFFNMDVFLPSSFSANDINENIDRKEVKKTIEESLDGLEVKYKEPLFLFYMEELSYKEIADIMKIPVSTVGVRIKRAKKIIKDNIYEHRN